MKMKTFFSAALAMLTLASCSKNDGPEMNLSSAQDKAYLALSIQLPQSVGTKAAGDPSPITATAEESTLKSVWLLGFDGKATTSKLVMKKAVTTEVGLSTSTGAAANQTAQAIGVVDGLQTIFLVANPMPEALKQIEGLTEGASTYADMNKAVQESDLATANGYMMVCAGSVVGGADDLGLVDVSNKIVRIGENIQGITVTDAATALQAIQANNKEKMVTVNLERVLAKVKLNLANGGTYTKAGLFSASVKGYALNTTNKSFFPYSPIETQYENLNMTATPATVYRQDPNYANLEMDPTGSGSAADNAMLAFNWLTNKAAVTWTSTNDEMLCLENTMGSTDAENYNNSTKVLFRVEVTPEVEGNALAAGEDFFMVEGKAYSFDGLVAYYKTLNDATARQKMNNFFKVNGRDDKIWFSTELPSASITKEEIEAFEDASYKVAQAVGTANETSVKYYKGGICYYTTTIAHDGRLDTGKIGRWGVVRNNIYTMDVKAIEGIGLPYVPDPTDPSIKDPVNPKPSDPETNDEPDEAFIAVDVVINPWTSWTQDVTLK